MSNCARRVRCAARLAIRGPSWYGCTSRSSATCTRGDAPSFSTELLSRVSLQRARGPTGHLPAAVLWSGIVDFDTVELRCACNPSASELGWRFFGAFFHQSLALGAGPSISQSCKACSSPGLVLFLCAKLNPGIHHHAVREEEQAWSPPGQAQPGAPKAPQAG